eukprot:scaffold5351_cov199-Alexandrium_tamarense.AAC.29
MSIAFGRYFDKVDSSHENKTVHLLLPIANPLRPSLYGDSHHGLCNRMTPVIVPLCLPRLDDTTTISTRLSEIRRYMTNVKQSNAPLLMTCLLSVETLIKNGSIVFETVSCVYSNVPGPTEAISLSANGTSRGYPIQRM